MLSRPNRRSSTPAAIFSAAEDPVDLFGARATPPFFGIAPPRAAMSRLIARMERNVGFRSAMPDKRKD